MPPVPNEVDDDVLAKGGAVLDGEAAREDDIAHRLRVDVQHRRADGLGGVARVRARAAEALGRREPELVVRDEVDGAADRVTVEARERVRLGDDALARDGGVPVDEEAHGVAALVAPRPRLADRDGVDRLEMRGVGEENDSDVARGVARRVYAVHARADVRRHVVDALDAVWDVVVAGDLVKELAGWVAQKRREQPEAAAVGLADDDVAHAVLSGRGKDGVQRRQHGFGALTRVALEAHVLFCQEELELLRLLQQGVCVAALRKCELEASGPLWHETLECACKPLALCRAVKVLKLGTKVAAVDRPQARDFRVTDVSR